MIDHEEAVLWFDKRVRAWLAEDMDAYLGMFAEDVVFKGPTAEPLHGHAAYAELVRRSLEFVRPVTFEVHEIAVHGSRVLAEWTQAHALRADGRQMSYRGMSVCEVRDGLITWWREYYDPANLQ